ncbi:hypothetical protein K491DRAFT_734818 [Lophiostoma macrostomum CBS 122681]|uniref:Uncharacterized protein n=1 Tax=Lophiostoma macrostomum CBS 122681 TaxID=1314788 RepID=A0A6A6SSF7_9PLEO|nr:hypothetical protein K491DRAFT_734818 [Lophiostoma macrostomum CBS 122681]
MYCSVQRKSDKMSAYASICAIGAREISPLSLVKRRRGDRIIAVTNVRVCLQYAIHSFTRIYFTKIVFTLYTVCGMQSSDTFHSQKHDSTTSRFLTQPSADISAYLAPLSSSCTVLLYRILFLFHNFTNSQIYSPESTAYPHPHSLQIPQCPCPRNNTFNTPSCSQTYYGIYTN